MAKIVLRNDSKENWSVVEEEVILLKGELAIEFDENSNAKLKVGDGVNVWKDLPYIIADNKSVDEELAKLNTDLETLKAQVEQQTQLIGENAAALVDVKNVNEEQELKLNSAHARIDTLIDNFSDNAAYDNAEVVDIRAGYDGTLHPSAGDAVRAIGYGLYNLSKDLQDFVGEEAVDGLLYEGNKLYLTANGVIVSDPVEIIGGTGGGGGSGSTNEYIITLVNLLDSRVISVTEKDTVKLDFEYSSIDEEGYPDGPGIGTVTVNNVRKATLSIPQGFNSLDVTPYLAKGQNTVRIQVENAEGSKKTLAYTVNVLALSITTTVAQMGLYSGAITIPYTVSGQGTKTVHFLMDDKEFATVNVDTSGQSRQQSIPVQRDGAHILKMYAEVESEGLMISSNTVSLGMLYYSDETTTQAILMMSNDIKEIDQGETISFPYLVYDPFTENAQIELCIIDENGENYYCKELTVDQTPKVWTTQDYPAGNTVFQIKCGETIQSYTIKVNPSTFNKTVITDGCVLDFNANGRSNGEANPESWSYGEDISATFSGFGWANADGWLDDENGQTMLRFLPGNTMTINYKPFAGDFRSNGYTIETELATHNVRDYDSIVISAMNGGRGLSVKSQQASLKSEQTGISIQFKEDSRVRLTFVVEQKTLNRFIYVYVNGVMCGVIQYPENDDFSQVSPVDITIGAESCGLDLYILRLYNKGFTRTEQLNNFICDRPTLAERIAADERNDILNEYTGSITIQDLPMNIPYMIIECEELPQFKGDKKKEKSVTYVEPMRPERSFTATGVQLDVQGTSSAGYPVKNYKVSLKGGLTYTNSGTEAKGFPIVAGGLEGKVICLKADFASSEQANNVMLVDYYEQNCPFKTPPQETDGRVRQGVRGFPCVVFWHDTVNDVTTFVGKYNFNDDKSNENVFGFDREKYPNCECWEFCNNTSDRVLFNRSEYEEWGVDEDGEPIEAWRLDFEARFPDLDDPYKDYTQFKRMTDWVVSTNRSLVDSEEEKAARLQKFKDEFEDYFEKDAMIFYYLFTEVFLLADNRAKNMFLTTFDGEHWFPIPYDMDTAIGRVTAC